MSSLEASAWQNKLISSSGRFPDEKQKKIIFKFNREEIFNHEYSEKDLMEQFYNTSIENCHNKKPKRPPNPFMILRSILRKIAKDNNIEIGDGIEQSKLAGYMWGGISVEEKKKFAELSLRFNELHKQIFPKYEYKPNPRVTKFGAVVDVKTAVDYQHSSPTASIYPPEEMEFENNYSEQIYADYPESCPFTTLTYPTQPNKYSSIAVNCIPLDINDSQPTPKYSNPNPYNPSSTYKRFNSSY
ncbi:hypothetical protein C1645_806591 [Glomus cerebriforme]|uniref:HMG box domain-containing protein n=1 Tax=Glomus cerebriforme TaxID=658196 RepID=A0A397SV46_9GLOM|nr:hypothetical protein C1645_806591 [Glomus cerebriforme]